ncbi:MAG: SulP family inorganic anion transporter [Caldilineaceae bacterium]
MRRSRLKPPAGFSLQQIISALSAALVISVIVVFVEVSFGAMIFSGAFSAYMAVGIGLCLAGAFIHTVLATLASSSHNTIAVVQDAPVAIIAAIFVTISASLALPDEKVMLATGLAVIVLTSALAGVFFWVLGRFNLGRLVRFIPYPVVGGFLAGTGYLLTVGGIGVMADAPLGQALAPAGPVAALAARLPLRSRPAAAVAPVFQFWVMPLLLVGGIAAFYALFLGAGGTLASATADGWLLGPFPSGRLWQPVAWLAVSQADWGLVFANVAKIATALLIGAVALLLNVSGLEVLSNEDVNLNRELRWSGVANLIGAVAAAPVGYTRSPSPRSATGWPGPALWSACSRLLLSARPSSSVRPCSPSSCAWSPAASLSSWASRSWWSGWSTAAHAAPAGLRAALGYPRRHCRIRFLGGWRRAFSSRRCSFWSTTAEWTWSVTPRRVPTTPAQFSAPLYEQLLERRGRSMAILTLQGYIFFGTAHRLLEQITARLEDESLPPLRYLVMDFRLVTGMDSSSALSFARLKQATDARTSSWC